MDDQASRSCTPQSDGHLEPGGAPSTRDLDDCIAVLEAIAADRALLAASDPERRRRLLVAAGRVSHPDKTDRVRMAKALRREDRRIERLHDETLLDRTEMRKTREAPVYVAPSRQLPATPGDADGPAASTEDAPAPADPTEELRRERSCYVCKRSYRRLHPFYDSLCPECGELNHAKRHQTARLDGRVALLTGGRIKIGYQVGLMLLRAGARVLVTTRFPVDAATRYAGELDFASWKDRLSVHGLDLRHAPSVELFAEWLQRTETRLDVLINNAAQTVRRPPAFYTHLIPTEETPFPALPSTIQPLLRDRATLVGMLGDRTAGTGRAGALPGPDAPGCTGQELVSFGGGGAAIGLCASARLSQAPCAPGDTLPGLGGDGAAALLPFFPEGRLDPDLQQVDLRPVNSWRLPLAEVPTPELLEVHLVNAIAPFILNSRLKPLMARGARDWRHIVNVSAMEAQFSRRKKTDKHPHTNMAKAALNMLTRTSAADYARDGIFMNSVDTGWVTDEDPLHHVARKIRVHGFHPPLDIVDGAARVCDPVFSGVLTGRHEWGHFYKDYRPVDW